MNILVGGFIAESNARVKKNCELCDFMLKTGDDVVKALYVEDLFEQAGVQVIPSIYADGRGGGIVAADAFAYIAGKILDTVRSHKYEIDGIFLFLHGASHILDLDGGSGEHYIIREIRKIVGAYVPIAMVTDPHGNLSQEIINGCSIVRTFRHSPHTDRRESHRITASLLLNLMENRRDIHPVYRKVPILLGGERTVSTDEPMCSVNKLLDEIESDSRILSCSYHIGYVRHDCDKCGASVVVVPNMPKDLAYAEEKADEIAAFVYSKRKEFHFTGIAMEPEEAMFSCLNHPKSPVYLTDSGDNCTAGAPGCNTYVLNEFLKLKDYNGKRILFACIADQNAMLNILNDRKIGDEVEFELGEALDELSAKLHLKGKVIARGKLVHHYGETTSIGQCCTISLEGKPIDVIVAEKAVSFAERAQYEAAGMKMEDYDLTVVKQGYLYPELKARAKHFVMSLTDGATNQRTEKITYKMVLRPMYPLDEV